MAPAELVQPRAGRNTEGVISMSTTTRLPHTSSAFLTAWWGDTPIAPILIWTNPGRRSHWLRDSKEADRDWGKRNVYTGVALPPEGKDLRHDHRVESHEAAAIAGLWCDLDWEDGAHKKKGAPSRVEVETFIATLEPKPNIVVNSGHGYQLWWKFRGSPWVFKNDAEREEAQQLVQRWQSELRRRLGKSLDATHDLARVMRLPGTTNYRGAEPVPVTVEGDDSHELAVEEWLAMATGWPQAPDGPSLNGSTSRGSERSRPSSGASATLDVSPDRSPNADDKALLIQVLPDVDRVLKHDPSKMKGINDKSANGCDLSLASYAAQAR